jgi:hypothetical protein
MINLKIAKIASKSFTIAEERPFFQVLFLKDDKGNSVEVEETEEVDFEEVKNRLEHGEAVFITRKVGRKPKVFFSSGRRTVNNSGIPHSRGKDGRRAS